MFEPGARIGKYKLDRQLGAGGFGMVFVAHDTKLGRDCALKFLLARHSGSSEIVRRFLDEARAAAKIAHAGIVTVFECEQLPDGTAYIAMELLVGESLEDRIERAGAMKPEVAIEIARQVAAALAAAHQERIIHRDLKPANVFLVPDRATILGERVKVLDFGIAKLEEARRSSVATGSLEILGTPRYMSPEQCRSAANVDERSDIYSLGVMLFEMLAGVRPFDGEPGALIAMHQVVAPPKLSDKRAGIAPAIEAFVGELLAKEPGQRPATMSDVIRRLDVLAPPAAGVSTLPISRPPDDKVLAPAASAETMALPPDTAPSNVVQAAHTAPSNKPQDAVVERTDVVKPAPRWIVPLAGVVLAGGAVAAYVATRPSSSEVVAARDAAPARDAALDAPADARIDAAPLKVPEAMVLIPEGDFTMGSTDDEVQRTFAWCKTLVTTGCRLELYQRETPPHPVHLSAYAIDRRERNAGEFVDWLSTVPGATIVKRGDREVVEVAGRGYAILGERIQRGGALVTTSQRDLPAGDVTNDGARAFCAALGFDLPTEAQWERAARGTAGRRFPWGDTEPTCHTAIFGAKGACPRIVGPAPVGYAVAAGGDITAEGVEDLAGNVSEWVRDRYVDPHYEACPAPCKDPVVEPTAHADEPRVVRGGAFNSLAEQLRSAGRSRNAASGAGADVGFRCASALR